jgi:hypothetical protein
LIGTLVTILLASTLGLVFFPRAICSIGVGKPGLGSGPLVSHWPTIDVTTAMGQASVSIPKPLPLGRLING